MARPQNITSDAASAMDPTMVVPAFRRTLDAIIGATDEQILYEWAKFKPQLDNMRRNVVAELRADMDNAKRAALQNLYAIVEAEIIAVVLGRLTKDGIAATQIKDLLRESYGDLLMLLASSKDPRAEIAGSMLFDKITWKAAKDRAKEKSPLPSTSATSSSGVPSWASTEPDSPSLFPLEPASSLSSTSEGATEVNFSNLPDLMVGEGSENPVSMPKARVRDIVATTDTQPKTSAGKKADVGGVISFDDD